MAQRPQPITNPRLIKLMELESGGRIKPEHQAELDSYRARGVVTAPKSLTESEAKTTNFYNSALESENEWKALEADPSLALGTQPVGMMGDVARAVLSANVVNSNTSAARQRAQQAKENFIRASLRLESGAAIGKEEFDRQDRIFYPQTGDAPDTLAQKARARQTVIEGFKIGAGAGSRQVDHLRQDDTGKVFEPLSIDSATDYALGLRDRKPGAPKMLPNGSVEILMPDGTSTSYPDRATYERAAAEDTIASQFGGDKNSEGYRATYKARFGEDAPLYLDAGGDPKPATVDMKDGATGAFGRGIGDTALLGGLDEVAGVADTLVGEGGGGSFSERLGRNITRNRGILAFDQQEHPYARVAGQVVGGMAIPIGAGARTVGQFTRVGALSGAAYGAGSTEGGIGDRAVGAIQGAVTGGAGGALAGVAIPRVAGVLSRLATPSARSAGQAAERSALREAAGRQDIPLTAADVRPGARNAFAYLEASPGGAGPAQRAMRIGSDATAGAVERLGAGGTARTNDEIGGMIQDAGRRAIAWSGTQKNRLYDAADRLAGGATVRSQRAVDMLDQNIAELSQTPNANRGILTLLTDMRGDLVAADGSVRGLTVDAVRRLRTAMRGEIGTRNLTMTDAERRVGNVIDAASDDITTTLRATNPRAAEAYGRADAFYRQRQTYITDIIQRFTGPRDRPLAGEKAFQNIMTMAGPNGDRRRLVDMMRALSGDEQSDVAATIAAQLGRRTPDADFSPDLFVSHAAKLTPGARVAIFGQQGADAVDDIVRVATAKRDVGNALNRSRSGQVGNYDRVLSGALGLLGAGGGYAAGGVPGAAVGAAAVAGTKAGVLNVSARLLTNRTFAQWLARAPSTGGAARITAHVQQLGRLAATQPSIRGEIEQLQRLLTADIGRASAEDGDERRQRPQARPAPSPGRTNPANGGTSHYDRP